jgi:RNA polymerase sigma factor (sigma-70 family)
MPRRAETPESSRAAFAPTRWTMVLSARAKDSPESGPALETLCRTYWPPLYSFARRQGFSAPDAQDFTQEFFSRLLQKDYLRSVAPEKGRFRSFLLVAFKRFLANERERASAQKRGGGERPLSLDASAAETLYRTEPVDEASAAKLYERRWALTLLERTLGRLRDEFIAAGKGREFEVLKVFLTAPKGEADYTAIARELGLTPGAARVVAHRLRRRYREIFHEEIAHTVADPAEIEDEVRHLLGVLTN